MFLRGDEIWIANADGSQPRRVLKAASGVCGAFAGRPVDRLLPNLRAAGGGLLDRSASGGAARRLTSTRPRGGGPVFTPDGQTIVFPSARGGSVTLWQIPVDGGSPRR